MFRDINLTQKIPIQPKPKNSNSTKPKNPQFKKFLAIPTRKNKTTTPHNNSEKYLL
jgi:hypothetical protein